MLVNNILVAGVGGQGTVLASRLIAAAALELGLFVRTSETIGMAQRGGSVVSHVRINSENNSSLIPFHTADLIIGFEQTEVLRNIKRLKIDGKIIVNKKSNVKPLDGLENAIFVDAAEIAEKSGSIKAVNTVMIGAAIKNQLIDFEADFMKNIIKNIIPEKYLDLNIKAFENSLQ